MVYKTRIELFSLFLTLNLLLSIIISWQDHREEFEGVTWLLAILIIQSSLQDFFKENYTNGMIEQLLLQEKGVFWLIFKIILDYWGKIGGTLAFIAFVVRYLIFGQLEDAIIFPFSFFILFPILISSASLASAISLKRGGYLLAPLINIPLLFPLLIFNMLLIKQSIEVTYFLSLITLNFIILPLSLYLTFLILKLNVGAN